MTFTPEFQKEMLACGPGLKAFAISLCGNVDRAEDLVQETYFRALAHAQSFEPGTNMAAWLFTILRNHFRSQYRKRRREVEDADGHYEATLIAPPGQVSQVEFSQFRELLAKIPEEQREALILVGAAGFSYEEASEISGVPIGTVKSRVNRGRVLMEAAFRGEKILRDATSAPIRPIKVAPRARGSGQKILQELFARNAPKTPEPPQPVLQNPRDNIFAKKTIPVKPVKPFVPIIIPTPLQEAESRVVIEGMIFVLERIELLPEGERRFYAAQP